MVKVFVSSTFRDFQSERDNIRNVVQPKLAEFLREYGIYFSFTDLRWGIYTNSSEEENDKKVLSVCLHEITQAKPFTIVLLGERYGYIPDKALIHNEAVKNNLILEDESISATQLEIEYSAFCEQAKDNRVFFYFREMDCPKDSDFSAENDETAKKQKALKDRIIKTHGNRVRFYSANLENGKPDEEYLKQLCEDIYSDLKNSIVKDLEFLSDLDEYEQDNISQWHFLNNKKLHFSARKKLAENLVERIITSSKPIAIVGKTGSGKSTLFSEIISRCKTGFNIIIPFFGASTARTSSESGVLDELVYLLENYLNESHINLTFKTDDTLKELFNEENRIKKLRLRLIELNENIKLKGEKILVAIDAIDQINRYDLQNNLLNIFNQCSDIQLFVTSQIDSLIPDNIEKISLCELSIDEKQEVLDRLLYVSGKELSEDTRDCILRKESTNNPLYLYLLIQRLLLLQSEDYSVIYSSENASEAIQKRLQEIIASSPDDIEETAYLLIEAIEKISSVTIKPLAESIAVSRYGLRQDDLEKLYNNHNMQLTTLDIVLFVNYIDEVCFYRNDGRIDFMHQCVRKAILKHVKNQNEAHNDIIHVLKDLHKDDVVKTNELQYHLIMAKKKKMLIQYISEISKNQDVECIKINAKNFLEILYEYSIEHVDSFFSSFDIWNDFEPYLNEQTEIRSFISVEDYVNFIYYLSFQIKQAIDYTRSDLELYIKICDYCIKKVSDIYSKNSDDPEITKLYSECFSCRQEAYRSLSMFEKAAEDADKAIMLWSEAVYESQTDNDILKSIEKTVISIVCKQQTENKRLLQEALDYSSDIRSYIISLYDERPLLQYLRFLLFTFFLDGITYYNMGPQEHINDSISSYRDGLSLIREYDREIIDKYLSDLESMFVEYLSKIDRSNYSVSEIKETAKERLIKAKENYISSPSISFQIDLFDALDRMIQILKESDSIDDLKEALEYTAEAVKHSKAIDDVQKTLSSKFNIIQMYIYQSEIYYKMHNKVNGSMLDGLSFNSLIMAASYIDKLTSYKNDPLYFVLKFDVYDRIFKLVSKMPEQKALSEIYARKGMETADEMYRLFPGTESTVIYAKAKFNIAKYSMLNGTEDGIKNAVMILEEIEMLLHTIVNKADSEELDLLFAAVCYNHASALFWLKAEKNSSVLLLERAIELAEKHISGGEIVNNAQLLLQQLT